MTPKQEDLLARDAGIKALHDKGFTLQAIGDKYGLTRERVRQILDIKYGVRRNKISTHRMRTLDNKVAED